jgi:hypothetical protein
MGNNDKIKLQQAQLEAETIIHRRSLKRTSQVRFHDGPCGICGKTWHWDMVFSEYFCFKGEISLHQWSVFINLSSGDDKKGPFAIAVPAQIVFCFAGIRKGVSL